MIQECPECNGKLSTLAGMCPHCGYLRKSAVEAPAVSPADTRPAASGSLKGFLCVLVLAGVVGFVYYAAGPKKPSASYSMPPMSTPYEEPATYPGKVRATCLLCKGSGYRKSPGGTLRMTCPVCNGSGGVGP